MSEETKQAPVVKAPEVQVETTEAGDQVLKRSGAATTGADSAAATQGAQATHGAPSEGAAVEAASTVSPTPGGEVAAQTESAPQAAPPVEAARPMRRMVDVSIPVPEPKAPEPKAVEPEAPLEDFGAMFEASAGHMPKEGAQRNLEQGDKVQGIVVHVGADNAFVDLGLKSEGYISRGELTDKEGKLNVEVGSTIEAYVISVTAGGIHLSKGLSQSSQALDALEGAFSSGIPVEGRVEAKNKGGYEVVIFGHRAFCPISQIDIAFTENPDEHVGKTYMFQVIKFDSRGKQTDVVVSRSELLRKEREAQAKEIFSVLEVGKNFTGRVRNIRPFGAFVDLGGVDGLVHVSEMSWDRVSEPGEFVKVGEEVTVKVLSIENLEAGPSKVRIGLSMKAVQESPWERVGEEFVEGKTYEGEVVRLESYGAFIQLAPGLDGLAHVSELSLARVAHPREVVSIGDKVQVKIKEIDGLRKRIGLSLKALQNDPWSTILERYAETQNVSGKIENIETFGIFVNLEPGLTGLIPLSEMNTEPGRDPSLDFKPGQEIEAHVLSIDPNRRRLTLSRREPGQERQSAPSGDRGRRDGGGGGGRRDGGGGRDGGRRGDRRPRSGGGRPVTSASTGGSLGTFADLFAGKFGSKKK